jgi:putative oxidoreductase
MNLVERLENWGDAHHPKLLDIIRIALGIFLCFKGFDFLRNEGSITGLMSLRSPFSGFMIIMIAHYVAFAHMLGGIALIVGVFTRLACLIQIPILLGAIIFINSGSDMVKPYSELVLSILVLLLLIYFMVVGNGPWSLKISNDEKEK